jgi:hypothetical protein
MYIYIYVYIYEKKLTRRHFGQIPDCILRILARTCLKFHTPAIHQRSQRPVLPGKTEPGNRPELPGNSDRETVMARPGIY